MSPKRLLNFVSRFGEQFAEILALRLGPILQDCFLDGTSISGGNRPVRGEQLVGDVRDWDNQTWPRKELVCRLIDAKRQWIKEIVNCDDPPV